MAKPDVATIQLEAVGDTAAAFTVEFTGRKNTNRYSLWVACHSYDEVGEVLSAAFQGVQWDDVNPGSGQAILAISPDAVSGDAFVAEFPDVWTARSNTVVFP